MLLSYLPAEQINRWLPVSASPFFVEDYWGNRQLYPMQIPTSHEYKLLDHAILRALLRTYVINMAEGGTVAQRTPTATPTDHKHDISDFVTIKDYGIVIEPTITRLTSDDREAVQIILDGLEPSSTQIFKQVESQEQFLAYCISLEGEKLSRAASSETVTITVNKQNRHTVTLETDKIYWYMAAPGTPVDISYELQKATINDKRMGTISTMFGVCGLIIDTRGRPFAAPHDDVESHERVKKWLACLHTITMLD